MTMEVLAAEFPDIFQQFIEIVPDPAKPDQPIYVIEEKVEPVTLWSVTEEGAKYVQVQDGAKYEYEEVEKAGIKPDTNDDAGADDEVLQATNSIAASGPETPDSITDNNPTTLDSKAKTHHSVLLEQDKVDPHMMEHDYGQKIMMKDDSKKFMVKDANKNNTKIISPLPIKSNSSSNPKLPTEVIKGKESAKVDMEQRTDWGEKTDKPILDDLDHLLNDLFYDSGDINSNVQVQFDTERSAAGCSWSPVSGSCHHGLHCPFTAKILGLDQIQPPVSTMTSSSSSAATLPLPGQQQSKVHNVVVLKQTPEGLVRVQQSFTVPQHQFANFQNFKNQAFRPQGVRTSLSQTLPAPVTSVYQQQQQSPYQDTSHADTMPLSDISNSSSRPMVYRPPPNSVVVKVPQVPAQQHGDAGQGAILCADCDSQFVDNKSLVKHTRNQHQVYQCSKCGESTVGYYRMASHTKKKHSKEPVFFCNCGRNFSEKRGLTKHQNSCTFYNNS